MVERTAERKIYLTAMDDRSGSTLMDKITKVVDSSSIIYSDSWRCYRKLINNFAQHCQVNHSENFVDTVTKVHTNTIEGNWCGVKMNIPAKHQTKEKINLYLTRYMLLRNEKFQPLFALLKYLFN